MIAAVLIPVLVAVLILVGTSVRLVQQYEKGIVLRFGRLLPEIRQPGLRLLVPLADRMREVSMQTVVMGIPAQGAIARDNVIDQSLLPRRRPGLIRRLVARMLGMTKTASNLDAMTTSHRLDLLSRRYFRKAATWPRPTRCRRQPTGPRQNSPSTPMTRASRARIRGPRTT